MTEFISHNKATVIFSSVALGIILSLVALVWGINNERIGKLERWRQEVEHQADVPLTKQRLDALEDKVKQLEDKLNKQVR